MNDLTAPNRDFDGVAVRGRYEELRRYVLGEPLELGTMAKGAGLALLKRLGMRAWLEAAGQCAKPTTRPASLAEASNGLHVAQGLDAELARVMATIVLRRVEQEQRT